MEATADRSTRHRSKMPRHRARHHRNRRSAPWKGYATKEQAREFQAMRKIRRLMKSGEVPF